MRARATLAWAITAAASFAMGWRAVPLGGQAYPTSEQTRAEFASICKTQQIQSEFFGIAPVEAQLRAVAPRDEQSVAHVTQRGQLAFDLIRIGRFEEALRQISEARAAMPEAHPQKEGLERALLKLEAIGHFLWGENRNCMAFHNEASCILPLRPEAIQADPEQTRLAGNLYRQLWQSGQQFGVADEQARWMWNLSRLLTGDYPGDLSPENRLPEQTFVSAGSFPLWTDIASRLGVAPFDLAGGAIVDDFDGDLLLDIVTSSWDPCAPMHAFRNDGRGGFEDVSASWGLDSQLGGLNLIQADYDGDGHLDILVLRGGWQGAGGRVRNSLLRNALNGSPADNNSQNSVAPDRDAGRFIDVTVAAGLAYPAYPTQTAAWADFDLDGDLDLYVGNESDLSNIDPLRIQSSSSPAYPSQLFKNRGDGTFVDIARQAGVLNLLYTKAVTWGDFDDDGDPDLFVSNFGQNRLYRNNEDRTFSDVATAVGLGGDSHTFAAWFFDFDNDGDLDLYVSDFGVPIVNVSSSYLGLPTDGQGAPHLYRNEGGRFVEVGREMGLDRPLLPMGSNFGDLDNDGWPDIYLGTGVPAFEGIMPNVFYRNDSGARFVDLTFVSGLGHLQKGHAVAFGDFDNDGDQDLYEQLGGAFPYDRYPNTLYVNPQQGSRWIDLHLGGNPANRFGVGARIRIDIEETNNKRRSVYAHVTSGGSFGASSLRQEIGLGAAATRILSIEVHWPGQSAPQVVTGVDLDRHYLLQQNAPTAQTIVLPVLHLGRVGAQGTDPADSQASFSHPPAKPSDLPP